MSIGSNSDWNWPSCERRLECGSRHFRGFDPDICRFREVTSFRNSKASSRSGAPSLHRQKIGQRTELDRGSHASFDRQIASMELAGDLAFDDLISGSAGRRAREISRR